jgi:small-conductance mechanosensitive channel
MNNTVSLVRAASFLALAWSVVLGSATLEAQPIQQAGGARVQGAQARPPAVVQPSLPAAFSIERTSEPATVTFFNRPIIVLRARVAGRTPTERVAGARRVLDELVDQGLTGPVTSLPFEGGVLLSVASRGVLVLTSLDIDDLSGETFEAVTAQAVSRLQQALNEATEAHAPRMLLRSAGLTVVMLTLGGLVLWGLSRAQRRISSTLVELAERNVTKAGIAPLDALRSSRVLDFQRHLATGLIVIVDLVVIYAATTFVLRQFPYTRPWGESMSGFLLMTFENLALGIAKGIPGLFTVLVIFAIVRVAVRLVRLWFDAVERGQARPRWIYPDTAQPTRRLVTTLLWLFAIVVAYPYMPGSQTEAFKGVSVFLGLMVTFGSSGLVNQIMSGFMITYSRAIRIGDFVKIGDVEGTVTQVGVLSTKVRSLWNEDVTIPNAVVVSQTTTDYSRFGDTEGVFIPTSVTIGYDAPWRQVQALLLLAAERTSGLRKTPEPMVLQEALQDFYVKYTLFACLERQDRRPYVLHALHTNIQDLFNEYGVQIMSPNYMYDPAAPKVVAKKDWFVAPARPDPPRGD